MGEGGAARARARRAEGPSVAGWGPRMMARLDGMREELVERILSEVDPRLSSQLLDQYRRRSPGRRGFLPPGISVVLAGHRASGKTRLLPHVARLLGRPAVDLDEVLARHAGRSLRSWVEQDEAGFRAAERSAFLARPKGEVVAVGGGFLALHPELLLGKPVVLVPVSFETYRERLLEDTTRPRLLPHLSQEEEIARIFEQRERAHARIRTVSLVDFLLSVTGTPRRVVTLPPQLKGAAAREFAWEARRQGADLLEVRNDLHTDKEDVGALAAVIHLIVSERGRPLAPAWKEAAALVDRPLGEESSLVSYHATEPLTMHRAVALWRGVTTDSHWKHVEPLGDLASTARLFETQERLLQMTGPGRVTVLATGPLALPFRCLLAERNALDYLALAPEWMAAEGQRLLADAVREAKAELGHRSRWGILGSGIGGSRSPRIHLQPFDRIDLPTHAPVEALVDALAGRYAGFAVTSPFKKPLARHLKSSLEAINTLYRGRHGWQGANTDVEGAVAALKKLGAKAVTVLGDGGATTALKLAAAKVGCELSILRRPQIPWKPITGTYVWTWPERAPVPPQLKFEKGARVAVIAYGQSARRIAADIRKRGGEPVLVGSRWFIAQAREQRALWREG